VAPAAAGPALAAAAVALVFDPHYAVKQQHVWWTSPLFRSHWTRPLALVQCRSHAHGAAGPAG
jgi:hypothetical protein